MLEQESEELILVPEPWFGFIKPCGMPTLCRYFILFYFLIWLHHAACGILVPQPGIEPMPSAVKAQSPNHWTAREFPVSLYFKHFTC